ncbi:right-handed parallel beta-helix repeat-containing protein [Parabacteroides sp. BX2]|uniref:Right-handed parallel beta-helix repeat-containing protein n=1 Tax=Parabacteroides segnis TaxID=2763058 RepID=A0ABR7E494_9BACT|nr:right-handed parallel beta-helix repeat-containing protein [Parabacteroides segnis]MBC5644598.1 right-handed parallel beta-helix repeat-containing protein [Parabacteroides segnis]
MKRKQLFITLFLACCVAMQAKEYHVSIKGNDANEGTEKAPFRTIGKAAEYAFPGDIITVHAGTYREWVNPPRGGESDDKRIVYRAAPGEKVEIKGSERITNWTKEKNGVWKVTIPNTFFGDYNPYIDLIYGDWFEGMGREHHTGEVFLNNKSLYEKETLDKVQTPVPNEKSKDKEGSTYTWYCENDGVNTTIWANFHTYDPNKELVEISTRPTCFYPEKPGIDYLTIQGFHISQAATQWGAPTAEQIGMIATHWNKGWIIENNIISNSKCSGITLGKERKTGHNVWLNDTSLDGSLHYIEVTFNTIRNGWNKENIGSHIVRNNEISHCEQTGICGSMGAAFSLIENNHIHDIWVKRQFTGAEIGGIKFHAAVDTRIIHNRIHNAGRALWLDWMTQGTRVSGNLFYDNDMEDLFLEVNHGPFLVDNNIFASRRSILEQSQGGAYVHNLIAGDIYRYVEHGRYTPYFLPHSTEVAGLSIIPGGDDRYINNLFATVLPANEKDSKRKYGLADYNKTVYPMMVDGNVYYNGALPFEGEKNKVVLPDFKPDVKVEETADGVYLSLSVQGLDDLQTSRVTTGRLGKAKLPRQAYEQPDGSPIDIATDYLGNVRSNQPKPGPLESIKDGAIRIKVW